MLASMHSMTRLRIRRIDSEKKLMQELRNSIVILKRCLKGGKRRSQKRETNLQKRRPLKLLK
jgi:hypothetical protein